jgi:phosphoribosylanthranilate isomerase
LVKVKICGITNIEDAIASVAAGCDALGFVFYRKSPRYISPQNAKKIIRLLPKNILKVGIFVNAKEKNIRNIARECKLNTLQFHGNESTEFCKKFKNYKIIKTFRVKEKIDLKNIKRYGVFVWLFDTFIKSKIGGTGKKFNWKLLRRLEGIKKPIFLSGGLNERNVAEAIKYVHPDWVDVSSSIEIKPGKKDYKKVKKFIEAVRKFAL